MNDDCKLFLVILGSWLIASAVVLGLVYLSYLVWGLTIWSAVAAFPTVVGLYYGLVTVLYYLVFGD